MQEIQMLLHTSGVNLQRQAEGRLTVSSLWFRGGGELPTLPSSRWTRVWNSDPVSSGLATLADEAHGPLPTDAQAWLSQAGEGDELVLVLDALDSALQEQGGVGDNP